MRERIQSIDLVRGLIMIVMTLDHTRDLLHLPGPNPLDVPNTTTLLFFTRWITHFCAPTFVFLSGVSACLAGQRRTKQQLTTFLLTRGLWLILSDLLIITLLFSFDAGYHFLILEVLSAIGFGLILLAVLIRAPLAVIATIGLLIFFGHNLLDYVALPKDGFAGALTKVFVSATGVFVPLSATRAIIVLYAVLPWAGALLLGYVFGTMYKTGFPAKERRTILVVSGISLITLFFVLRLVNHYGDPAPWVAQTSPLRTLLSFLNTTKQSPSLLFFCMTLGPILLLLSLTETLQNGFAKICRVFGQVPYFYFIVHFCVIRIINMLLIPVMGLPYKSDGSPIVWQAAGFGRSLGEVYVYWAGVVCLMYFICRWYGRYKQSRGYWWLSYV